jgi:hypothetical protein
MTRRKAGAFENVLLQNIARNVDGVLNAILPTKPKRFRFSVIVWEEGQKMEEAQIYGVSNSSEEEVLVAMRTYMTNAKESK